MTHLRLIALAPLLPLAVAALGVTWTVWASSAPAEDYAIYYNDDWHFSIAIPTDIKIINKERQGDAELIQLSTRDGFHMFEVRATPYSQMDVALGEEGGPSNFSDQPTKLGIVNVYRDGLYGVAFQRNGIAYVVTSILDHDDWLLPILQSWEFTD
jgi:hypothetical protein